MSHTAEGTRQASVGMAAENLRARRLAPLQPEGAVPAARCWPAGHRSSARQPSSRRGQRPDRCVARLINKEIAVTGAADTGAACGLGPEATSLAGWKFSESSTNGCSWRRPGAGPAEPALAKGPVWVGAAGRGGKGRRGEAPQSRSSCLSPAVQGDRAPPHSPLLLFFPNSPSEVSFTYHTVHPFKVHNFVVFNGSRRV